MYDPDKYKAARSKPSQARGKERVRVILAAALELFGKYGIDDVTTNDIASQAHIPIGSLYRYYPNKEAIIIALTELYVGDLCELFDRIKQHPFLPHLSWDEVLLLMVDAWVNYSRLNGPFGFLYASKSNPRIGKACAPVWKRFVASFDAVIDRRCPQTTPGERTITLQLCVAAADLGVNRPGAGGVPLHHEAVGAIASYMLKACQRHEHES